MSELNLKDFEDLGEYAGAGLYATNLALQRAARSSSQRRIPIAGAAVSMSKTGELTEVTVGNNNRIPAPDTESRGYPTDHGETDAIRNIDDFAAVDWHRVVFATTLSPCIMCTRTLIHLYHLGLNKIVIAESTSFGGEIQMLGKLPGMILVKLSLNEVIHAMSLFSRTYPWDWQADIGNIPPDVPTPDIVRLIETNPELKIRLLDEVGKNGFEGDRAGIAEYSRVKGEFTMVGWASDQRKHSGGNPTRSATMIAMGNAGSAVNLRQSVLVLYIAKPGSVSIADFGDSSLGACELFRPAAILSNASFDGELTEALRRAGISVVRCRA
ncbi:MAG: hypothetical protein WC216_09440 [Gallionella sp.]|jgi:tRNA(Arg) A34 adenosine deaminase TadA